MLRRLALALLFCLASTAASAQEFIAVPDMISDEDFYRLVACAAPPGGTCAKPFIRWPMTRRADLRIGIADVAPSFPSYKLDLIDRAIDAAIAEINATGADVHLTRAYEGTVDIPFYLIPTPQGARITGTSIAELDGSEMAIARVALRSRGGHDLVSRHRHQPRHPSPRDSLRRARRAGPSLGLTHRYRQPCLYTLNLFRGR